MTDELSHILHKQRQLTQLVRETCISVAITYFEDARTDGMCAEGAWEVAIAAMRKIDLEKIVQQLEED